MKHPSLTPVKKKPEKNVELVKAFKKAEEKEQEYTESKRLQEKIVKSIVKEALIRLEPFAQEFSNLKEVQAGLEDVLNALMANAELDTPTPEISTDSVSTLRNIIESPL